MDMEEIERELKASTLNELEDHLEELGSVLYSKDHENFDESDFDKIFRIVHSVKGNTRAAGFETIAQVSHSYESKLIAVKNNEQNYNTALHDISLAFLHGLNDCLDTLKTDINSVINLDELMNQIEKGIEKDNVEKIEANTSTCSSSTKNILLIDDDRDVREIIECYLEENFDASFTHQENGRDGLRATQSQQYDVIICDYKMPILDGKEFIASLRSTNGINQNTPIIFLSGYRPTLEANKQTWENVFFTEKPFTESKLSYYVKCALATRKEQGAA